MRMHERVIVVVVPYLTAEQIVPPKQVIALEPLGVIRQGGQEGVAEVGAGQGDLRRLPVLRAPWREVESQLGDPNRPETLARGTRPATSDTNRCGAGGFSRRCWYSESS